MSDDFCAIPGLEYDHEALGSGVRAMDPHVLTPDLLDVSRQSIEVMLRRG